jgi:hypothetical protein
VPFAKWGDSMIKWGKRTPEVSSLLNPPFCAAILYTTIAEYQKKAQLGMAFPLLYIILPIILHKDTRSRVSSRTNMIVWLQRNPDALIGFPERARSLVPFTNEAIEFLLHQQIISIDSSGIMIKKPISKARMDKYLSTDYEIADCVQKTAHLGRWFLSMRSDESIYIAWGVRP